MKTFLLALALYPALAFGFTFTPALVDPDRSTQPPLAGEATVSICGELDISSASTELTVGSERIILIPAASLAHSAAAWRASLRAFSDMFACTEGEWLEKSGQPTFEVASLIIPGLVKGSGGISIGNQSFQGSDQ